MKINQHVLKLKDLTATCSVEETPEQIVFRINTGRGDGTYAGLRGFADYGKVIAWIEALVLPYDEDRRPHTTIFPNGFTFTIRKSDSNEPLLVVTNDPNVIAAVDLENKKRGEQP